jgi:hypothetical protein
MSEKRGRGRPRGPTHGWVTLGLQVSPEMAAKLADLPRGDKGRTIDAALRAWFEAREAVGPK